MRTRSQPASPGGLVSLDDLQRATRRTRTTRSTSRGASQEPTSQQPSTQQPSEPVTQPTTRSKSQPRTNKKTTIAKKTTSAASITKSQSRKGSKRGTRNTSRKASQVAAEETQESIDENYIDNARMDNEENNAEVGTDEPESGLSTSDAVLLEPKNSEREYQQSFLPSEIPLPPSTPPSPSSPHSFSCYNEFPESSESKEPEETGGWDEFLAQQESAVPMEPSPLDILGDLYLSLPEIFALPAIGETSVPSYWDLDPTERDQVDNGFLGMVSPLPTLELSQELNDEINRALKRAAERSDAMAAVVEQGASAIPSPAVDQSITSEAASTALRQPDTLVITSVDEPTGIEMDRNTSEPVNAAEPTARERKEPEQSDDSVAERYKSANEEETVSPFVTFVDSNERTAVEDASISELTELFAKLSLADVVVSREAAVSSMESTTVLAKLAELNSASAVTHQLASIYDDAPPSIPAMEVLRPAKQVQQFPLSLFSGGIPESPSTLYTNGRAPSSPNIEQSVEEPLAQVVLEEFVLIAGPPLRTSRVKSSERRVSRARRRRQLRGWPDTPLSPIPEERDLDPPSSSSVGSERVGTSTAKPVGFAPRTSIQARAIRSEPSPPPAVRKGFPKRSPKRALHTSNIPKAPKTPKTQDSSQKTKVRKKLTDRKVNRKRSRTEISPDRDTEPITPHANKRRNLGPPGSTPYTRRMNRRMSRAVPLSDRQRRRTVESEGRIHNTIFRLPQYVAQTEADRRASETSASPVPPSEPLQTGLDLSSERDQTDVVEEESTVAPAPSTPETPRRGWRGLLGSVPRSFSRLLPRFGRTPARSEAPVTQQSASERIQRTRPVEASPAAAPETESPSRRRSSEQPPAKRPRNLSYSLFPAPIDRNLYLGDIPTKSTTTAATAEPATETTPEPAPALQRVQQDMAQKTETKPSTTSTERGCESANNTATESQKKKRKRSPSPDVIPNPVGSSYGMDLDYFCYSSDSEDEVEPVVPQTEPRKVDTLGKAALRNIAQTERPASKKVRFDASPEDTPSKRRARATDPYNGTHFIGMGGPQASSAPTTPTPTSRVIDPRQRPGFIPNRSGTFELDYDAISDDSDSSGSESPSVSAPTADTRSSASTQPDTPQSAQPSAPRATPRSAVRPAQAPSTPAKVDDGALAKARSKAEKYKPKTPSGLRTTSRYSSPLTAPTPDLTPAQPAEKITEKFGDDQFAKDAQWLYENCPSGDLRELVWPARQAFGEGLDVSADSLRILDEIWDPAEVDNAYAVFQREYADFQKRKTVA